jgi:hypothetical protein
MGNERLVGATFEWLDSIPDKEWSPSVRGWQHLRFSRADFLRRCCIAGTRDLVDQFKLWASKQTRRQYALAWDEPTAYNPVFVIARHELAGKDSERSLYQR